MTGYNSKRNMAQDKMELADAYASAVAETPNMPTPLERKLAVERIERARNALEAALQQQQDKLTDDAQGYIAQYEAALLVSYQRGFADGKLSAQRKPLTDEQADQIIGGLQTCHHQSSKREFLKVWLRDWATHNIKENT